MPHITLNKTEYHYQQSGKGTPVIFAHGLFVDHSMFKYQIEVLQENFTCYAFDMPAHGKSTYDENGWSLDDIVEDLRLFILKKNLHNVVLIGQSQGGMVFMRLASKYPELVSKLILIGTSARAEYADRIPFWREIVGIFRNGNVVDFKNKMELIQENIVSNHFIKHFPLDKAEELAIMQSQNPLAMALATETAVLNRTNVSALLPNILCPTLILCGKEDTATPLEVSTEIKENIKHSKIFIIPNSAHHIPLENPKELNRLIINFLK